MPHMFTYKKEEQPVNLKKPQNNPWNKKTKTKKVISET